MGGKACIRGMHVNEDIMQTIRYVSWHKKEVGVRQKIIISVPSIMMGETCRCRNQNNC